jgi:cell division septation protein DedD
MKVMTIGLIVAAMGAMSALAQAMKVEAVQYPAWLDRGGHSVPLSPGVELQANDQLRTGQNARLQLKLAEGSTVRLGENARFKVERVQNRGIFTAALNVLTGAFRFTTEAVAKARKRDITVKVSTVTAGIRGTDLWGKSTEERDLVCLIEGKISVASENREPVTLDQPLDFYQRPRGGEPQVSKVEPKQLEQWARETAISPDGAAARAGGAWRVVAITTAARDEALAMNRRLRAAGYPAEVASADGRFAVQIRGMAGEAEARALAGNLRSVPGAQPVVLEGSGRS